MAANNKPTSVAKDLFEDMGRQVEGMKASTEDGDDQRVVDEIESLCMNCHADVRSTNNNLLLSIHH
jgi:zinc finger protein